MDRTYKWLPVIDETLCTGCGACVEACGPRSLALIENMAVLLHAHSCGSEEHCIAPCLEEAIHMEWVRLEGDGSRGIWKDAHEA